MKMKNNIVICCLMVVILSLLFALAVMYNHIYSKENIFGNASHMPKDSVIPTVGALMMNEYAFGEPNCISVDIDRAVYLNDGCKLSWQQTKDNIMKVTSTNNGLEVDCSLCYNVWDAKKIDYYSNYYPVTKITLWHPPIIIK